MKLTLKQIVKKYQATANEVSPCWLHRAIKQGKLQAELQRIEDSEVSHWLVDEQVFLQWRKTAIARKTNSQFVIICEDEQEMAQFAEFKKAHKLPSKLTATKLG